MKLAHAMQELGILTVLELAGTVSALVESHDHPISMDDIFSEIAPLANFSRDLRRKVSLIVSQEAQLFSKKSLILTGPELLLIEILSDFHYSGHISVLIDSYVGQAIFDRISQNVPKSLSIGFSRIPDIITDLAPNTTAIITVGLPTSYGYFRILPPSSNVLSYILPHYYGNSFLLNPLNNEVFLRGLEFFTTVSIHEYFDRVLTSEMTYKESTPDEVGYFSSRSW